MNKIFGIILASLAISLCGVNAYLFFSIDDSENDSQVMRNIENIYALQKIDGAWSVATLQTLAVVESDFDQVAAFLPQFRDLRNQLGVSEIASNNVPAPLKNKLLSFLNSLEGKEQAIEEFKSNLAVTRNSVKYLPLAAKALFDKTKEMKNKALEQQLLILDEKINDYLNSPEPDMRVKLLGELNNLDKNLMVLTPDVGNPLGNYISHAIVLVERKESMDRMVARVTDDSVSKAGAELIMLYKEFDSARVDERNKKKDAHHFYTLAVTVLLSIVAVIAAIYVVVSTIRFNNRWITSRSA